MKRSTKKKRESNRNDLFYSFWSCLFDHIRQLMGEDLDTASLRELQYLEQQFDSALKNIRRRKVRVINSNFASRQFAFGRTFSENFLRLYAQNHLMNESISELWKKVSVTWKRVGDLFTNDRPDH